MVAVVVGSRLGLEQTSAFVLGSRGQIGSPSHGRSGENIFVNGATGNVVVTDRDEFLIGLGPDSSFSRTHNSQATADGDNGDSWRLGVSRRVTGLTGTVNTTGSTITRTDWEGSEVVYTWNSAKSAYQTTEGAGAYDLLTYASSVWTWTDGDTQVVEKYDSANGGRITHRTDTDGNSLTFAYGSNGLVSRVTTADGGYTDLTWGGTGSLNLTQMVTTYKDEADNTVKTLTRVRYAYDGSNRLSTVTVDLSPTDSAVTDGRTYVTTYTYDGTSKRIASISQTDGSKVEFTYESSGLYRVTGVTQIVATGVTRATSYAYTSSSQTTITDSSGQNTVLLHGSGLLNKITWPAAVSGGTAQYDEFVYVGDDLVEIKRNGVSQRTFGYNTSLNDDGLWVEQRDRQGQTIKRTYDAKNSVLTETTYTTPAGADFGSGSASGALTTRYAYDSENHLTYAVSAEGRVTKFGYDTEGRQTSAVTYTGALYSLSGLTESQAPSDTTLNTWVGALSDKTAGQRTDTAYFFNGDIQTVTQYSALLSTGYGDTSAPKTVTHYVHDQQGRVVSRYVDDMSGTEAFTYDGFGRMLTATDFHGQTTRTAFYDALGSTVVTMADGLNRTSVYNRAGELVSFTETERGANLVNTVAWPDAAGSTPSGAATVDGWSNPSVHTSETHWTNAAGPDGTDVKVMVAGQSDGNAQGGGNITNAVTIDATKAYEFVYYFKKTDLTKHHLYFGLNESSQSYVENITNGVDDTNPYFYNASASTQGSTLNNDRWYKVVGYVLPQGSTTGTSSLGGVYDTTTGAKVASTLTYRWDSARPNDQVTSRFFLYWDQTQTGDTAQFYKPEIRQIEPSVVADMQPAAGTQYRYDNMGRLRSITDPTGVKSQVLYDLVGRKVADIDGDGSLTEYKYDLDDHLVATVRYATRLDTTRLNSLRDTAGNPQTVSMATLNPVTDATNDSWTWNIYDKADRLVRTIDGVGSTTTYEYDGASRLVKTQSYVNQFTSTQLTGFKTTLPTLAAVSSGGGVTLPTDSTSGDRITRYFYDMDGRQVGSIDGEGAVTQFLYDAGGRVVETRAFATLVTNDTTRTTGSFATLLSTVGTVGTNTRDQRTWSVYDGRGFLRGAVDGEGQITLYDYSPLGHVTQVVRGKKITAPTSAPSLSTLTSASASGAIETTNYTRNQLGQVLTESRVLASGTEVTTYTYDVMRRLTSVATDVVTGTDRATLQRYDRKGRLVGQLSAEGAAALAALGGSPTASQINGIYLQWGTTFAYDAADRLISRADADGVNGAGNKTFYYYDADGRLSHQVNALGEVTEYRYDALNRLTDTYVRYTKISGGSLSGLKGGLVTSAFTSVLPSANTKDARTVIAYNVTDTVAKTTTFVSDPSATASDSNSLATEYTYNAFRQLATRKDPKGRLADSLTTSTSTFAYDRRGLTTQTLQDAVSGIAATTTVVYDAFGRATDITSGGQLRKSDYDRVGRVIKTTNALTKDTTYAYDARGNVITLTDRTGRTTTFDYNAFSRTVTSTVTVDSASITTTTTYDDRGLTLAFTDGAGRTTTYAYDRDGALTSEINGLGQTTLTNTYDTAGRLYDTVNGAGTKVRFTYDAVNRVVTEVVDPGGLALTTTYVYADKGQRTSITDANGRVTEVLFDNAGRQTKTTVDPSGKNLQTVYTVDRAGNTVSVQEAYGTSDARETIFEYDNLDRLTRKKNADTGLNIQSDYTYDAAGNVTKRIDKIDGSTNAVSHFRYDAENRLTTSLDAAGGVTRTTYDDEGRIIRTLSYATALTSSQLTTLGTSPTESAIVAAVTANSAKDLSTAYVYDGAGRLSFVVDSYGRPTRYEYDGAGNVIRKTEFAGLITGGPTYVHATVVNAVGSMTSNTANRVTRSAYNAANQQAYSIDAEGRVTAFVYDGSGAVVRTTRYSATYTSSSYALTDLNTWAAASVSVNNRSDRILYDAAGRQVFSINAEGYVTETRYTADRATSQIRYAAAYLINDGDAAYEKARLFFQAAFGRLPAAGEWATRAAAIQAGASDATTAGVYAGLSEFTTLMDGKTNAQIVTLMYQNALGRDPDSAGLATWTAYLNAGGANTVAGLLQAFALCDESKALNLSPTRLGAAIGGTTPSDARVTQFAYDTAGRVNQTTDPVGTVTKLTLDGLGRATSIIEAYGVSGQAAETVNTYDKANRLLSETRASGATEASKATYAYDGLSRMTSTIEGRATGVTEDESTTTLTYDGVGRLLSQTRAPSQSEVSTTSWEYDALGQVTRVIDGGGRKTWNTYDAAGRKTTVAVQLTSTVNATTTNTYDNLGNLKSVTDPRGSVGYFYYDKLGRVTLQVDPEDYATETTYSLEGQAATVTRRALKVSWAAGERGTIVGVNTDSAEDAVTTMTRDKLDRVISIKDAENKTETYTLNAFGDRLSVENSIGGTTTYTYDKRGRMLTETLPVSSVSATGTVLATTVVNSFEYDARGNLTKTIEASNITADARTTNYAYDKLDRLVQKTSDAVIVTANDFTTSTVTPTETIKYDRRGNVIETVNAGGARTVFFYDDLNRKVAEVDALGTLRKWTYDAANNATAVKVYDTPITLPTTGSRTIPTPGTPSTYRETLYEYDLNNRQTKITVANLLTGQYGSSYATTTADVVVTADYDAQGNVWRQTDARGNISYTQYDALGRVTGRLDAEGYLTRYALDGDGNVVTEVRYANKSSVTPTVTTAVDSLIPTLDSTKDRTTTFEYDRNGRRTKETRTGVVSYSVNATTGAMTTGATSAVIQYSYDGLGNVTRREEANTDAIEYVYDSLGRQIEAKTSAFADYAGTSGGIQRQSKTSYNGLGATTRTTEGLTGASSGDLRISEFTYVKGRLTAAKDATGFERKFEHDVMGRVVKEEYDRALATTGTATEGRRYTYDALGRVTAQASASKSGGTWSFGDERTVAYNAHGQVTAQGLNGLTQETFAYDSAGRMWRSTAGDGVLKFYIYDKGGNATLVISSAGTDLSSHTDISTVLTLMTNSGANAVGAAFVTGVNATISVFDKRGMVTSTREPQRQLSRNLTTLAYTTATIERSRAYNAFGEVTQETDARGGVTDFTYNTMGRLIEQKSPTVAYTSDTGAVSSARPTEARRYDISGRLVATQDANGNWSVRTLLSGSGHGGAEAQAVTQFNADGGKIQYGFDVFGDLRKVTDALGHVTTNTYDKVGRLTTVVHPGRAANTVGNPTGSPVQLTDNYEYDGLGQRIRHWNSQFGNTVKELIAYDREGRVTSTSDYENRTTSYAYAWDSALTTTGLGTFGGWTKTTTTVAAKTSEEKTDYFGRIIGRTDLGGRVYSMTFDKAGRLTAQTSLFGEVAHQSLTYGWYNTGQMAEIKDVAGNRFGYSTANTQANYNYDAAGNRVMERYLATNYSYVYDPGDAFDPYGTWTPPTVVQTTATLQDATATYDALGRMTQFTDTAVSTSQPTVANYTYDLKGNVRSVAANYQSTSGAFLTADTRWYKYDVMDRMTVADGGLSGGVIGATYYGGAQIEYDMNGNRARLVRNIEVTTEYVDYEGWEFDPNSGYIEEVWDGQGDAPPGYVWTVHYTTAPGFQFENYDYTADGYLAQVTLANDVWNYSTHGVVGGTPTVYSKDVRDALGRLTSHKEYGTGSSALTHERTATYDMASNLLTEVNFTYVDVPYSSADYYTTATTTYDHRAETSTNSGVFTGQWLGVVTRATTTTVKDMAPLGGSTTNLAGTRSVYSYVWWDGAQQSKITYDADTGSSSNALQTSTFAYDVNGHLTYVNVKDGRARNVTFVTDVQGQVLSRTELDNVTTTGDPKDLYYYFGGLRIGEITNNAGWTDTYISAVQNRAQRAGATAGPFITGYQSHRADFGQAYEALTPGSVRGAGSSYTIRDGDTLQSIAASVWGDTALWYLIAEANGLTGSSALTVGLNLLIPAKAGNIHNTSQTFRPYDPNKSIGDVNPTQPKPPAKPGGCGVIGQIIATVIAVVVAAIIAPYAAAALSNVFGGATVTAAGATASSGALVAGQTATAVTAAQISGGLVAASGGVAFGAGAIAGAAAAIASQGFLIATGAQDKLDWKGIGISALSGGIGGSLGKTALGRLIDNAAGGGVASTVALQTTSNVITQGIAVATGLQDKFSWSQVAISAVMAGVGDWLGNQGWAQMVKGDKLGNIARSAAVNTGSTIAGAAAMSLLNGTSFGDNLIAVLPQAIGQTIGQSIAGQVWAEAKEQAEAKVLTGLEVIREAQYFASEPVRLQVEDWMAQSNAGFDQASFPELREAEAEWAYRARIAEDTALSRIGADASSTEILLDNPISRGFARSETGRVSPEDYYALVRDGFAGSTWSLNLQPIKGGNVGYLNVDYLDGENRNIHKGVEGQARFFATTNDWYALVEVYQGPDISPLFRVANLTQNTISEEFNFHAGFRKEVNGLYIDAGRHPSSGDPLATFVDYALLAMADLGETAIYTYHHPQAVAESLLSGAVYAANPRNWDDIGNNFVASARQEFSTAKTAWASGPEAFSDYFFSRAGSAAPGLIFGLISGGTGAAVKNTAQNAVASAARHEVREVAMDAARAASQRIDLPRTPLPAGVRNASAPSPVGMRGPLNVGACFVGGTLVHTPTGPKPIESLNVGDHVLSQPELTGEIAYRRINETFRFEDKPILEVAYLTAAGSTGTITATPNHPFWVAGEGWTAAELLEPGHVLELQDRSEAVILSVIDNGDTANVYNFEVDGFHTYYVGEAGVWVHNTNCQLVANAVAGGKFEARVLANLGLKKNWMPVVTAEGIAIPDAITSTSLIEIKNVRKIYATRQLRIESEAARRAGKLSVLIHSERTVHISENAKRLFDIIDMM